MDLFGKLVCLVISGLVTHFFYKLHEGAISRGKYYRSRWSGEYTLWSIPFYISFVFTAIFVVAVLEYF